MATLISLEDAMGQEQLAAPTDGKPRVPANNLITLEEATGTPHPAAHGSLISNIGGFLSDKQSYKDMAGYAAGVGAQLNDMFTGLGKSLLGGAAYLMERSATKGEMVKQVPMEPGGKAGPAPNRSAPKAQRAKDMFPEELATPWKKVAEAMGPEALSAYNNNGVGWVMGKISEVIEKGGKAAEGASGLPASDFVNAVDLFTGILGARALKPQAQAMLKQRIGQMRSEMKTAKKGRDLTPEELAAAYTGTQKFRPGDTAQTKPADFEATQEMPAFDKTQPVEQAAPAAGPRPVADVLDPYKVPAIAAGTAATAWALQEQLDDEQLAALGVAGAAAVVRLDGVPDVRLVDMLKQGGPTREAAAAQIYRDNVPKLTRGLRKYEKQGVEIEDVVQRTMEKGLRAIEKGSFAGDAAIGTYLYRIAENEVKSGMRYEKVRPKTESMDMEETPGIGKGDEARPSAHENIADESLAGRSPEAVALNNVLGQRMAKALDALPDNFRRPFEMRELEGMDYAEIAEALGQPIGTVRSQINRAKASLQQRLKDYAPEGVEQATPPPVPVADNPRNVLGGNQRGSASPEQIFTLAAATAGGTLGAFLSEDTPLLHALYGALGGGLMATAAGRKVVKHAAKEPDWALGMVSTRLGKIAPSLKGRFREHEQRVLKAVATTYDQVTPFLSALRKQPAAVQEMIARDLLNGKMAALNAIPELTSTYPRVRATLANIEGQLQGLGRFAEGVGNYFPRIVKDYEGLREALGKIDPTVKTGLEKALVDANAKMMRKEQRGLTEVEQSIVTNRFLFQQPLTSGLPGYAMNRRIKEVTEKLQPFYETPAESLLRYLSGSITDIEAARFFGRDLKVNSKGKKKFTNVDESIGNLTANLLEAGKITPAQSMEVHDILQARFTGGEKGMNQAMTLVRNVTNAALLGQVASAATQIGDSLASVYHWGLGPTLQGVVQTVRGKSVVTPKELGLVNHLAEELSDRSASGKVLHNVLRYSGFQAIDLFAKQVNMNAALAKARGQARSAKGQVALAEKYGYAFEGEMPQLIADLQANALTPRTQRLAFETLSDIQPISRAELPQAYLEHPNGRLLYQLKTYMLKQADIVRRDAYDNIASGEPKKMAAGLKNLGALATLYAFSNVPGDAIKDWLSGREVDVLSTPALVENVFKTFGLNRYASDRIGQGKIVETGVSAITPPLKVIEDILAGREKAISYTPLIGRPLYDRAFDGNVKREIAEKKLANKGKPAGTGEVLSDEAKEYLERKRQERKEKAEQGQ
jgi:RNA polymerase sigma-70 factor, ECF subfamily